MSEALDLAEVHVDKVVRELPQEGEEADLLGRVDALIRMLERYRSTIKSELTGPVEGRAYRVREERKGSRSYNTAGLVHAFNQRGIGIGELVQQDVARISWQWTKLQRALYEADITLTKEQREITDDGDIDAPLVGETWSSSWKVEPL